MTPDPELDRIQAALSRRADAIPGQMARRTFLRGALATSGALALLPSWLDGTALAAGPLAATDGVLVVIQMGGGNDGLNTLVPLGNGAYAKARGSLAVTNALPIAPGFGLHPKLVKLKARYDAGQVAIVRGVGQPVPDLSHFSSTAAWMAGTATKDRTTGWLGRWLDGVPDAAAGLRAVQIGSSVPLHLIGRASTVTAVGTDGDLFGADRSQAQDPPIYATISAFGATPTAKGFWADRLAAAGRSSIALATRLQPLYTPAFPNDSLSSQLVLAARLINAGLGIRVISCSFGSFDTHDNEASEHGARMQELDDGLAAFAKTLAPKYARQTALMTFSEFGRRLEANASGGTDHGSASMQLVIGDNVKGGLVGEQPSLTSLDDRGDLKVKVDFRSVYSSVLASWLAADAAAVLGASYPSLPLFRAAPGRVPPTFTPLPRGH
ncbi:MAG: hypothetical protein JWN46_2724 [Acidimicrobiales bacterium]|nr:hypothetical protein [Acidimicrobiales bacterium]